MKNDNRGRDIFMGLVAVATLIVAIIGATLAYFSITATSNEGALNATAAIVSINYEDGKQVTAQADELIPSSLDVVKQVYEANVKNLAAVEDVSTVGNSCIDDNGRQVCSAYRFSISSEASRSITASLNNEENTFTYLSYAVYNVTKNQWLTLSDEGNEENPDQDLPLTQCSNSDDDDTILETKNNQCFTIEDGVKTYSESRAKNSIFGLTTVNSVPTYKSEEVSETTQVYDIILFIKESGGNQNIDQGKKYSGTIIIDVLDGGVNGNITGCVGPECQK